MASWACHGITPEWVGVPTRVPCIDDFYSLGVEPSEYSMPVWVHYVQLEYNSLAFL